MHLVPLTHAVEFSMSSSSPDNIPETLVSVPNDLEAAMIVSTLAAQGVDATTSGEFTAGFRAEAPGEVKVLVRRSDLQKAQAALGDMQRTANSATEREIPVGMSTDALLKLLLVVLLGVGILMSCF